MDPDFEPVHNAIALLQSFGDVPPGHIEVREGGSVRVTDRIDRNAQRVRQLARVRAAIALLQAFETREVASAALAAAVGA